MTLSENQSLPAKKMRRDLDHEFVPLLINELSELACRMARRGLLQPNSVANRELSRIIDKFGNTVLNRAKQYFLEHVDPRDSQVKFEIFLNSVISYIYSTVLPSQLSKPPFEQWKMPLESSQENLLKWVKAEADILFPKLERSVINTQKIKDIIKAAWNDPVLSKVISTGIITFIGLIWLMISGFIKYK